MQHPYSVLQNEYAALIAGAYILPKHKAEADATATRLLRSRSRYATVQEATTVPMAVSAPIHERECNADFRCAMCNGERIIGTGRRTTLVPRGRGPYETFEAGADDAFAIDGLDKVAAAPGGWTIERALYQWEVYNGFGPRAHGRHSGYPWAGTNVYDGGKYVEDNKWDPNHWDTQLGTVAVYMALIEQAPDLALPRALPTITAPTIVPRPAPGQVLLQGDMTAAEIQQGLNVLGCTPPLAVDGNYGRITKLAVRSFQRYAKLEVDGLAGPKTQAALLAALADHKA